MAIGSVARLARTCHTDGDDDDDEQLQKGLNVMQCDAMFLRALHHGYMFNDSVGLSIMWQKSTRALMLVIRNVKLYRMD